MDNIKSWTNTWHDLKKEREPNKHRTPFDQLIDTNELLAFIAVLLATNQNVYLPRYELYFQQKEDRWLFHTPGFSKVFTERRFRQLNRYIFFADPESDQFQDLQQALREDKLCKIRPFIEHLQKAFAEYFNCGKCIAIDEAMVPFKGKLSIKQRIFGKPVRWGIKMFELCDSETEYLSRFEVYLGKGKDGEPSSTALGKAGAVVARLTSDFHGKGHELYTDNWYTSLAMCLFLQSRDIYVCGTTRSDRKGYPQELKNLKAKDLQRGDSDLRVYKGHVAFTWKDNKIVHFLSSVHSPEEVAVVQRKTKERQTGQFVEIDVPAHKIVLDYNANMGAVDLNDQMTTVHKSRKQMRWYLHLFIKGLELAVYNAYVLQGFFLDHNPPGSRKRDFLAFREDLIMQLIGQWRASRSRPGRKRKALPSRLENVCHLPVKGEGEDHTCEVCREKFRRFKKANPHAPRSPSNPKMTKITFKCMQCDVYLCISRKNNCFKDYHELVEFWRH